MKKVMIVFGTRPEAIKMCPLVKELRTRAELQTIVCVTGQHRQMLDQVLRAFDVVPEYDLSIMQQQQTLFDVTIRILEKMRAVLSVLSIIAALVYFIMKLVNWYGFPAGNIPILLAVLILGSMQLFFIGLLGEYILAINTRLINRPLVIEKERINWETRSH